MLYKKSKAVVAFLSLLLIPILSNGQDDKTTFSDYKKRMKNEYNDYKHQMQNDYANFRKKANEEYVAFVKKQWEEMVALKSIEPPVQKLIPPVVCPELDIQKDRKDDNKPYEEVIVLDPPKPQPQPVEPPKPIEPVRPDTISLQFYGTLMQCELSGKPLFTLTKINEKSIAEAWDYLSSGQYDGLLSQCLKLRSQYALNDWGYIKLALHKFA